MMKQDYIEIIGLAVCIGAFLVAGAADTSQPREGGWKLSDRGDYVRLELSKRSGLSHWRWSSDYPVSDLHGLSRDQLRSGHAKVKFSLDRDAGSFVMEGDLYAGSGGGSFQFAPNGSFLRQLHELGFDGGSDEDLIGFAMRDISIEFAREVKRAGIRRASVGDLARLRDHGANVDWIREVTGVFKDPDVDDVIRLRDHGVDGKFLRALQSYGLEQIGPEQAVRLHDHGVSPGYLAAIVKSGYTGLSADEMIRLHDHGVNESYLTGVKEKFQPDDMIKLHDHGVNPEYLNALRNSALKSISVEEIVRLHDNGVDARYLSRLTNSGFAKLSVDQIIKLHQHGVD